MEKIKNFLRLMVFITAGIMSTPTPSVAAEGCNTKEVREWIEPWERNEGRDTRPEMARLRKALAAVREAVEYPRTYASQCESRKAELTSAIREYKATQEKPTWALFIVLLFIVALVVIIALIIAADNKFTNPPDRKARLKELLLERDELRAENDIEQEKFRGQLFGLKFEKKGARLMQQRDYNLLEALQARLALDQAVRTRPRQIEHDPLSAARAALSEEIENRKADGHETSGLEEALRRLEKASS